MKKRYALVLGTRPELIKLAAFIRKAKSDKLFELVVIHTGQHFDQNMSGVFLSELELPTPDMVLEITGKEYADRIGDLRQKLEQALVPQVSSLSGVMSLGDTNSTLVAGLVAARLGIPLIHIEAGLRSRDTRMPEEANRIIIDHLSEILFTTEESGTQNLRSEHIDEHKVYQVGNVGIESLELYLDKIRANGYRERLGLRSSVYVVATVHRREHLYDERILNSMFTVLQALNRTYPVVLPLHPATKKRLEEMQQQSLLDGLTVIEPLGYFDFMNLVMGSRGVLTDSGGVQEETSHLGIPCCTLRDNTERPVTVTSGSNKLFPTSTLSIDSLPDIKAHLERNDFSRGSIPMWDTQVTERMFSIL